MSKRRRNAGRPRPCALALSHCRGHCGHGRRPGVHRGARAQRRAGCAPRSPSREGRRHSWTVRSQRGSGGAEGTTGLGTRRCRSPPLSQRGCSRRGARRGAGSRARGAERLGRASSSSGVAPPRSRSRPGAGGEGRGRWGGSERGAYPWWGEGLGEVCRRRQDTAHPPAPPSATGRPLPSPRASATR